MGMFKTLTADELQTLHNDAARLLETLRGMDCDIPPWAEHLLTGLVPRAAAEVATLRDALGFYADMNLWQRAWVGGGFTDSMAHEDGGEIARHALRGCATGGLSMDACNLDKLPL